VVQQAVWCSHALESLSSVVLALTTHFIARKPSPTRPCHFCQPVSHLVPIGFPGGTIELYSGEYWLNLSRRTVVRSD